MMCRTTFRNWALTLFIVLILIPFSIAIQGAFAGQLPAQPHEDLPAPSDIYLPLVFGHPSSVEITDAWLGNADGLPLHTFLPDAPLEYTVVGVNFLTISTTVDLTWNQSGPCGAGEVFTKTLELDPGLWVDVEPSTAPDCLGDYQATVQITNGVFTSTNSLTFRVATASVVLSEQHGFDRCNMPTIAEMQTWWESSPYYVANVYLGGISYDNTTGCSNKNVDINWMQSVADQGWAFLLAWVGPQSPCSGYTYKMSYDPLNSIQQGRTEAELAIQAAAGIGLPSSIIIYYDIEGYGNEYNTACRNAVDAFLQGWSEQLDQLGARSGAYGSPCNSHISDWADNDPPPDDIWAAHWIYQSYNPFATVWDLACLPNDLWTGHQRVRQYAGDHTETWGGLPLRIDSNVLDGEVVALGLITSPLTATLDLPPAQLSPQLSDLGLLSPDQGWVLRNEHLLVTADGGAYWLDRTPPGADDILAVQFIDPAIGLLLYHNQSGLGLLSTSDAGVSWRTLSLPLSNGSIAAAVLDFTDLKTGVLSLKLSTGSSFNLVREFATGDGGQTWQGGETLSMPVNEGLPRLAPGNGNLPQGTILADWYEDDHAWALVQQGSCQGDKVPIGQLPPPGVLPLQCTSQTQLWSTEVGGQTWQEITWKD